MMFNFSINDVWNKIDLSIILGEILAVYRLFPGTGYKFQSGISSISPLFEKYPCAINLECYNEP